jgi:hypothetical protein
MKMFNIWGVFFIVLESINFFDKTVELKAFSSGSYKINVKHFLDNKKL